MGERRLVGSTLHALSTQIYHSDHRDLTRGFQELHEGLCCRPYSPCYHSWQGVAVFTARRLDGATQCRRHLNVLLSESYM